MSASHNESRRGWVLLFALALTVRLAVAALIPRPGYMDTAYYAAGALRLVQGGGLSEPFIWNYLHDPAGIPHPGFLYWMPLPSLLASVFAALSSGSFFALQVPFAVLSALVPVMAYGCASRVTKKGRLSWAAGLLAVFSGFFFPYWTLPETFAPFAVFGGAAILVVGTKSRQDRMGSLDVRRWLVVGLLAGLAHLTRADGVLLLPIVTLAPLLSRLLRGAPISRSSRSPFAFGVSSLAGRRVLLVVLGYLLTMAPWFVRNLVVIGMPLSPAATKTIWLTNYDDLFCYDCDLSLSSYLAWGWGNILRSKVSALWINAQRLLAEDAMVLLLPFALVGFYRRRRCMVFLLASLYLTAMYLVHSLVFTFPGQRGGFFHASGAVLPVFYAAAVDGLDAAVTWMARRRRAWRYQQARTVFAGAAVVMAVALSGYVAWRKIPPWRRADAVYEVVDQWLTDHGRPDAGVMVGNPPAFWYHTGRAAIVIPNGDLDSLLSAADQYGMGYVLLEFDHPAGLADLHAGRAEDPRLTRLRTWSGGAVTLYAIEQQDRE